MSHPGTPMMTFIIWILASHIILSVLVSTTNISTSWDWTYWAPWWEQNNFPSRRQVYKVQGSRFLIWRLLPLTNHHLGADAATQLRWSTWAPFCLSGVKEPRSHHVIHQIIGRRSRSLDIFQILLKDELLTMLQAYDNMGSDSCILMAVLIS